MRMVKLIKITKCITKCFCTTKQQTNIPVVKDINYFCSLAVRIGENCDFITPPTFLQSHI